jgi:hypothetical protein
LSLTLRCRLVRTALTLRSRYAVAGLRACLTISVVLAIGAGSPARAQGAEMTAPHGLAATVTGPNRTPFVFPPTAVGKSSTVECFFVYGGWPNGSGSMTVASPLGAPFTLSNLRVVPITSPSCSGTPVTLPFAITTSDVLVFDVTFAPTSKGQFTSSVTFNSSQFGRTFTYQFFGTTVPATCKASATTICLNYGRFAVSATWQTSNGQSGAANMEPFSNDTGQMWFFDSSSIEAEVKVVDGCALGGHYWVFAGGLTNVRVAITVTDTATGVAKVYRNRQGTPFQPIQDTLAFDTCP